MTTYILDVSPSSFEMTQRYNDESFTDAVGGLWTRGRNGNRWVLSMSFSNLSDERRAKVWGLWGALRGQQHRLRVGLQDLGYVRRSPFGGAVSVGVQADPGATSITLQGADPSVTDWALAGDFLSFDDQLKLLTQNADSDVSGNVTLEVWPEVHQTLLVGASVQATSPRGIFYMEEHSGFGSTPFSDGFLSSPNLTLVEDVYA